MQSNVDVLQDTPFTCMCCQQRVQDDDTIQRYTAVLKKQDVVYLNVKYDDRETVKAVGARWDSDARQWFIDAASALKVKGAWANPDPLFERAVRRHLRDDYPPYTSDVAYFQDSFVFAGNRTWRHVP